MPHHRLITRRGLLRDVLTASALPAVLPLAGCDDFFDALHDSCPDNPGESGGIDWTPDVMHPVFYGFQDFTEADRAPGTLRIWYPTYEGFTEGPPILKLCLVRWPLVLFLHGQPPSGCAVNDYHKRWAMLPAVLARSGFVVVVPSHFPDLASEASSPAVQSALEMIDWARNDWTHAKWVDQNEEATIAAGHSYGAILAARVAHARRTISAYVGLSAPFGELGAASALSAIQDINAPSFFMWGTADIITSPFEILGPGGVDIWDQIPAPKYSAVFPGEHFDYINSWSQCSFPRGSCALIEAVAGELAALFISRYAPVNLSNTQIPVNLEPPNVSLTTGQQFFAGGHLSGLQQFEGQGGCALSLSWKDGTQEGSRQLGP